MQRLGIIIAVGGMMIANVAYGDPNYEVEKKRIFGDCNNCSVRMMTKSEMSKTQGKMLLIDWYHPVSYTPYLDYLAAKHSYNVSGLAREGTGIRQTQEQYNMTGRY